ncbi:Glutathione gamma-glutamylcysteinyltransferase 1 (LjPCS1-8R) (Phytochelatin synthase 1) [Durusdinium trenchii]|uniref:glutathione gamma-glutamylcysteinyltransferase n=1 Tax=Durusdinium trenchii TaxID=1381693 RepID=A0ABP0NGT2_9DINO
MAVYDAPKLSRATPDRGGEGKDGFSGLIANSFARMGYLQRPMMDAGIRAIANHLSQRSNELSALDITVWHGWSMSAPQSEAWCTWMAYGELLYHPQSNLLEAQPCMPELSQNLVCAERLKECYLEARIPDTNCLGLAAAEACRDGRTADGCARRAQPGQWRIQGFSYGSPTLLSLMLYQRPELHRLEERLQLGFLLGYQELRAKDGGFVLVAYRPGLIMNSYAKCMVVWMSQPTTALEEIFFLNSTRGADLLRFATHSAPFWQLSPHFLTELPGMCGPTTAIMVLNALHGEGLPAAVSPTFSWSFEEYHYWDSKNLWSANSTCVQAHTEPWKGSLEQVAALMSCNGAAAEAVEASKSSLAHFRTTIKKAFLSNRFVSINFDRRGLQQQGVGHHSPIGAYDETTDRVLVLDVARYKYPPWWAFLPDVFAAMQHYVPGNFSTPRGYIEVGMPREDTTPSQALVV